MGRHWAWLRCPFGFINSGSEFNIFLSKALPDAASRGTITYVDDILIKTETFEKHLEETKHVLTQLKDAGAKIAVQKAQWCRTKVNFLGHEITEEGLNPQKKRVEALFKLKDPTTLRELRSLLGLTNYSRKFIEHYAEITQPLVMLLKKEVPWQWGEEQIQAVKTLKAKLANAPCLAYPIMGQQFFVELGHTESCLTAVLYQKHDQQNKIIAFASKALSPVEKRFNECEKALLAAVWAVQQFRPLVQGEQVVVETCHQSLQYLISDKIREGNLSNSRITSWMMAMQGFPIEVRYAKSKKNPVAQGLAELHDCQKQNCPDSDWTEESDLPPFADSPHKIYDEGACATMPTVFVDGCSFHVEKGEKRELVAGIGNVWVNCDLIPSGGYNIGSQTSQVAELLAVYWAIKEAIDHNIRELVVITDSTYVRNGFVEYLPGWKKNGMMCANGKPLKHAQIILAIDQMVESNDMTLFWKKTKGHSRVIGQEKQGND